MRLKLEIGGQVVASLPLSKTKATNLEYVYTKRNLLAESCAAALAGIADAPVYFIEVASRMNPKKQGKWKRITKRAR